MPDISYIVSAFNRPLQLRTAVSAIAAQTHGNFECIVTDNATDQSIAKRQEGIVKNLVDPRFTYIRTVRRIKVSDPYWSAEWAIKNQARGTWLCFPCDDTYLAPEFGSRMLGAAHANNWDLVICGEMVVGPDASGGSGYRVWKMTPGRTIKTSLMVRAKTFAEYGGFTGKPNGSVPVGADYFFGWELIRQGVRWGTVNETMVVHN